MKHNVIRLETSDLCLTVSRDAQKTTAWFISRCGFKDFYQVDRAAEWPNPKCGPPHTTFLQAQVWPNNINGPPKLQARKRGASKWI